ncbi:heterokaryon incompatibility protein-domain-containing protein, partial [Lophiotrema nucula]
ECIDEHQHPLSAEPNFVPMRLLKLEAKAGRVHNLRLVADMEQAVQYLAMSYCWGGEQNQKTTTANLKEKQQSISFDTLPRTLQDAVEVTAGLVYEYIWIDSLCIIQDDEADKSTEITQMPLD